jgi:hypothetical protein
LAEVVHAFLELLYDIAVELSGVQDEQGCRLDRVRVAGFLGSLMVVACLSPTAGCAAYGQYVKRGFLQGRVRSWPDSTVAANDQRASCVIMQSTHEAALDVVDLADLKRRELELT